jgi:chemotaxis protein MotA
MDIVSVVGTILAFVVIILGTILKGSSLDALWNPAAFVIVFVGTFAALLVPGRDGRVLTAVFNRTA